VKRREGAEEKIIAKKSAGGGTQRKIQNRERTTTRIFGNREWKSGAAEKGNLTQLRLKRGRRREGLRGG